MNEKKSFDIISWLVSPIYITEIFFLAFCIILWKNYISVHITPINRNIGMPKMRQIFGTALANVIILNLI